jgi:hypothetical protein
MQHGEWRERRAAHAPGGGRESVASLEEDAPCAERRKKSPSLASAALRSIYLSPCSTARRRSLGNQIIRFAAAAHRGQTVAAAAQLGTGAAWADRRGGRAAAEGRRVLIASPLTTKNRFWIQKSILARAWARVCGRAAG